MSGDRWWTVGSTVRHRKTERTGKILEFRGGRIGHAKQGSQRYRIQWDDNNKIEWCDRKELRHEG